MSSPESVAPWIFPLSVIKSKVWDFTYFLPAVDLLLHSGEDADGLGGLLLFSQAAAPLPASLRVPSKKYFRAETKDPGRESNIFLFFEPLSGP